MSGFQFSYQQDNGTMLNDGQLKEVYKRDSTLQWKSQQVRKIADTYEHPEVFYRDKATAIDEAADAAADIYKNAFKSFINKKMPGSLAHARAMRMAASFEELTLANVELDFPSNLSDLSLQLGYDRGTAKNSGFATPSTAMASKRKKSSRK